MRKSTRISPEAQRAFDVLSRELRSHGMYHFVAVYDPTADLLVPMHSFPSVPMLTRALESMLARVRDGTHKRQRRAVRDASEVDGVIDDVLREMRERDDS